MAIVTLPLIVPYSNPNKMLVDASQKVVLTTTRQTISIIDIAITHPCLSDLSITVETLDGIQKYFYDITISAVKANGNYSLTNGDNLGVYNTFWITLKSQSNIQVNGLVHVDIIF